MELVGYDSDYTVGVWVGFDKEKSLGIGGSVAALPTWAQFMDGIGAGTNKINVPKNLQTRVFCADAPDCKEKRGDWAKRTSQLNERCSLKGSDIFVEREQNFWSRFFSSF